MIDGEFYLFKIKNMTAERPLVPDSSPKQGTEEYRRAKEAVNKDGWEDNAAVIIGTKEELAQRREQLEQGRETVDLMTYIHRNAVVEATSAELMDDNITDSNTRDKWNKIPNGKYFLFVDSLFFKSKDGSIKSVRIRLEEINEFGYLLADLKRQNVTGGRIEFIEPHLKKFGFVLCESDELEVMKNQYHTVFAYRKRKDQKEKEKGFEF